MPAIIDPWAAARAAAAMSDMIDERHQNFLECLVIRGPTKDKLVDMANHIGRVASHDVVGACR